VGDPDEMVAWLRRQILGDLTAAQIIGAGDRVAAWRIGVQYTAVVKRVGDYGDGRNENFRRLALVRDDDGAEVEGFSNHVMVIQPAGATRSRHFPGGHYTDLIYGNGGMSRHQCGRLRFPDRTPV
jgi:hypothetical protein